jgi:hypothetical protein
MLNDVNVGPLDIAHTWDADLDAFLVSPEGTRAELFTSVGGGGDNFTGTELDDECASSIAAGAAPFGGCYQPEGLLSAVDGQNSAGVWTLEITDDVPGDPGTLQSWQLELCSAGLDADGDGCTAAQEEYPGEDMSNPGASCAAPPAPCYSDSAWYDFYDVPVPARADPLPNGSRDRAINLGDVGAVLFYAGASPTGVCGDNPNGNGVDYDCNKDGSGAADGVDYDRTASAPPNPPWEAGPPNSAVTLADVGAVLAQAGLGCTS